MAETIPNAVPNADYILAGRKQIGGTALTGWADQLDDIPIPDDMALALKGAPGNAGVVYIGVSSPAVQSVETSWPLLPNEAITYRVRNAKEIWFSGNVAGDFINFTVEQRRPRSYTREAGTEQAPTLGGRW